MKCFYSNIQEFEKEVKENNCKIIDFGGKRSKILSALVEINGILKAILILR